MKPARWLPLAAFALLAVLLAAGVWMSRKPDRDALPSPLIGKPAPDFALPVLHDPGYTVKLSDLRGQPFLLNVWGSWCVECRVEHPVLTRFAASSSISICFICSMGPLFAFTQATSAMPLRLEPRMRSVRFFWC